MFSNWHLFCQHEPNKKHCESSAFCIEIGKNDEMFEHEHGIRAFERLTALCRDVGTDWLNFISFDGTHEFCKDDSPIERLIKDISFLN